MSNIKEKPAQVADISESGDDKDQANQPSQQEEQSFQAHENPLHEDLRLTHEQMAKLNNQQSMGYHKQTGDNEQYQLHNINESINNDDSKSVNGKGRGSNIFGKGARTNSSKVSQQNSKNEQLGGGKRGSDESSERDFEKKCKVLLVNEDYESMENEANDFLRDTQFKSFKGYFYLAVSLYKQSDYENAIKAFKEAESIQPEDAQLHYNLGLSYFKLELYNPTVEHWRKCIKIDPTHKFVYNNLAFLFNLHQFYPETINICGQAKLHIPEFHNCHRHWAFALFKRGEMAKAVKKIKKGIEKNPKDADNWIIWGVILRYHGSYKSARHKFVKALKLDNENETAKQELQSIERIIDLDNQIPLEAVPNIKRNNSKPRPNGGGENQESSQECLGICHFFSRCSLF